MKVLKTVNFLTMSASIRERKSIAFKAERKLSIINFSESFLVPAQFVSWSNIFNQYWYFIIPKTLTAIFPSWFIIITFRKVENIYQDLRVIFIEISDYKTRVNLMVINSQNTCLHSKYISIKFNNRDRSILKDVKQYKISDNQ